MFVGAAGESRCHGAFGPAFGRARARGEEAEWDAFGRHLRERSEPCRLDPFGLRALELLARSLDGLAVEAPPPCARAPRARGRAPLASRCGGACWRSPPRARARAERFAETYQRPEP